MDVDRAQLCRLAGIAVAALAWLYAHHRREATPVDLTPICVARPSRRHLLSTTPYSTHRRTVVTGDAVVWLKENQLPAHSLVFTSLPDVSELDVPVSEWRPWFVAAAKLILERAIERPGTLAVFYQTDILDGPRHIDKAALIGEAAQGLNVVLRAHKIVYSSLNERRTGSVSDFSHLLIYEAAPSEGATFECTVPDMIPRGARLWSRGTGVQCAKRILGWVVKTRPDVEVVVDPFCGIGTLIALANHVGLRGLGVEISPKSCKKASRLDPVACLSYDLELAGKRPRREMERSSDIRYP